MQPMVDEIGYNKVLAADILLALEHEAQTIPALHSLVMYNCCYSEIGECLEALVVLGKVRKSVVDCGEHGLIFHWERVLCA